MEETFGATLNREGPFAFCIEFDHHGLPSMVLDEPEPLGENKGPNATRVLAAAVAHCLTASLLFCLQKSRIDATKMETKVSGTIERNEAGRLRIGKLTVDLVPEFPPEMKTRITRCLELFEEFCIVTESVRNGIDVEVNVRPEFDASLAGIG